MRLLFGPPITDLSRVQILGPDEPEAGLQSTAGLGRRNPLKMLASVAAFAVAAVFLPAVVAFGTAAYGVASALQAALPLYGAVIAANLVVALVIAIMFYFAFGFYTIFGEAGLRVLVGLLNVALACLVFSLLALGANWVLGNVFDLPMETSQEQAALKFFELGIKDDAEGYAARMLAQGFGTALQGYMMLKVDMRELLYHVDGRFDQPHCAIVELDAVENSIKAQVEADPSLTYVLPPDDSARIERVKNILNTSDPFAPASCEPTLLDHEPTVSGTLAVFGIGALVVGALAMGGGEA